jgi:hypothetical protein
MSMVTKHPGVFLAAAMVLAGLAGCADVRQDPVSTTVGAPLDAAPAQNANAPSTSVAF